ncbi:uncharacterized protein BJ171DRAFT_570595 [Polychytrium aggregatum]|uniref:uncharacterized protein n=1 Tax=Polychytrium aggregatum TaxID=110093 RepID=UPI0022FDC82A|nr:uncharacterized protein BJ171DRAFT_570595 [Polychytrium aggregatum]KAI9199417.1 hypothetical protein BJ171DRAFT_570595 [Polychytrium aggregatum]
MQRWPKPVSLIVIVALVLLLAALFSKVHDESAPLHSSRHGGDLIRAHGGSSSPRIIMDTLRVVNFRSAEAFETSPIFKGDKHPDYDLVVDVGTYDGADFTIPAYKKGYTVFSFELSPQNQALTLDNFAKLGLAPGKDYTVVDVVPGTVPDVNTSKRPHIYFFKAGASNRTVGVSAAKDGVFTEVSHTPGSLPIVRIDDIIQPNERVYLFKVDAQGHEYPVTDGARQLLQNNVHSLQIEFWPTESRRTEMIPRSSSTTSTTGDTSASIWLPLGLHSVQPPIGYQWVR